LPPPVAATIELRSVTVPAARSIELPVVAVLPRSVLLVNVTLPAVCRSPPPNMATLPPNVLFVMMAVPELSRPPPPPSCAVFVSSVTPDAFSVPEALAIPPPWVAELS
jgi:hypothetical protein